MEVILRINAGVLSEKVQEKLFKLGYTWNGGSKKLEPNRPYLQVWDDMTFTWGETCGDAITGEQFLGFWLVYCDATYLLERGYKGEMVGFQLYKIVDDRFEIAESGSCGTVLDSVIPVKDEKKYININARYHTQLVFDKLNELGYRGPMCVLLNEDIHFRLQDGEFRAYCGHVQDAIDESYFLFDKLVYDEQGDGLRKLGYIQTVAKCTWYLVRGRDAVPVINVTEVKDALIMRLEDMIPCIK